MRISCAALCALVLFTQVGGLAAEGAQAPALVGVITYPDKVLQHADAPVFGDQFGYSVATSGDDIVVGVLGDDTAAVDDGSVYVFTRGGGAWPQVAKLRASDPVAGDQFGVSVDLDGDTMVVGALGVGGMDWGAAYVFERVGGVWGETQKLFVAGLPANALLGTDVAVSGDFIALSALGAGGVYIFQRGALPGGLWGLVAAIPGPNGAGTFGFNVDIAGDQVIVGEFGAGLAYIYDRAINWGLARVLSAPGQPASAFFGFSVGISGDTAIVGAVGVDLPPAIPPNVNQGGAYIFQRDFGGPGAWGLVKELFASDYTGQDQFGSSVAVAGDLAVVGAFADDPYTTDSGSAYAFQRNAGGANAWGETNKMIPLSTYGANQWFGRSAAASPTTALVGAPNYYNGGNPNHSPGYAYVYEVGSPTSTSPAPGLVLDGLGGVHAAGGATLSGPETPYFGFDIAVDIELVPNGYYVLDGFGFVSAGGAALAINSPQTPYFGFNIAVDLELVSTGYYVLDGLGGVHAGGNAPPIGGPTPYFGFDIAVDMEMSGTGYYVLDGFGGVHAGGGAPPIGGATPYFGFDAAADMELVPNGYYVLDSFGSVHAGGGAAAVTSPYFGFAVAVDLEMASTGFYVLDGWGGVHAGGGAPAMIPNPPYWGYDIARDLELQ